MFLFFSMANGVGTKHQLNKTCLSAYELMLRDVDHGAARALVFAGSGHSGFEAIGTYRMNFIWMDEIRSHQLAIMRTQCFLVFTGESSFQGF